MGVTQVPALTQVPAVVVRQRITVRRRPGRARCWPVPPSTSTPFQREDGAWTRNANGYDLAEIVCQQCVLDDCAHCISDPHVYSGWSCCACNGRVEVIGAAPAANGKERP